MTSACRFTLGLTSALFAVSVALAQEQQPQQQPMTPESATDEQTMTPENAEADRSMTPEDANDTQTNTPANSPNDTAPTQQPSPGTVRGGEGAAVPPNTAAQDTTATSTVARAAPSGCWAKLYYSDNFVGNNVTLLGPADVPDIEATFRSVEVGPDASLTLFNEENFADEGGRFDPGRKAATLAEAPGLEDFESLRITCREQTPPAG